MEKDILAIDVDGTIAELSTEWLRLYNRDYNDTMTKEAWTSWGVHKLVKPECGLKIYEYIEDPSIYDNVLPIEGSQESIEFLSKFFRIIYVTNSTLGASGAKYRWLEKYNFINRLDDYIECKDKSLIRADLLIDDNFDNVNTFKGYGVLYTQPWNKTLDWQGFRIDSWLNFLSDRKVYNED